MKFQKILRLLMKNKLKTIALFIIIFHGGFIPAQEDWKLIKEKNGIQVFTKSIDNFDFKSFKAHILLDTSIQSFVAVLNDIENFKDWGYKIMETSLLKRNGDTLQIYYSVAKAPFPYKNRDGIYLNRFKWTSDNKTLSVDIEVLEDYLEANENLVRVKGQGFWKVIVLPTGQLDITFQMQLDPGGNVPAWMANIFVDDSPYYTLLNLKNVIKKNKYQHQKFNFID